MGGECGECGAKQPEYDRKKPDERKQEILNAAIEAAKEKGYRRITRAEVAIRAKVSFTLVTWYFENMELLKREIMRAAVELEIPEIIFQGLVVSDAIALNAPIELRAEALRQFSDAL